MHSLRSLNKFNFLKHLDKDHKETFIAFPFFLQVRLKALGYLEKVNVTSLPEGKAAAFALQTVTNVTEELNEDAKVWEILILFQIFQCFRTTHILSVHNFFAEQSLPKKIKTFLDS